MNIDLSQFCSRDHGRPNLHAPFSIGEWTYATDGYIALRVPRMSQIEEISNAPAIERLPFDACDDTFTAIPEFKLPETAERDCIDCEGRGFKHDCPTCQCICRKCHGTGFGFERVSMEFGSTYFNARNVLRIMKLPGLKLGPVSPADPAPFIFDGGGGLIMPMRGPALHNVKIEWSVF